MSLQTPPEYSPRIQEVEIKKESSFTSLGAYVISSESTVSYVAQKEFFEKPTEVVIGVNNGVSGKIILNEKANTVSLSATLNQNTFDSGSGGRDDYVRGLFTAPILINASDISLNIDPSIGICWKNIGPGLPYEKETIFDCDDDKIPLPKTFVAGAALETGLSYKKHGFNWRILTLIGSLQWDKYLVGENNPSYNKRGAELTLGDFFSYRIGSLKDEYLNGEESFSTNGYGIFLERKFR